MKTNNMLNWLFEIGNWKKQKSEIGRNGLT